LRRDATLARSLPLLIVDEEDHVEPTIDEEPGEGEIEDKRLRLIWVPRAADLPDRRGAVLAVVYLVFTEGHARTRAIPSRAPSSATRRSGSSACCAS
jgi:predicted RNA polymerase sigma factor